MQQGSTYNIQIPKSDSFNMNLHQRWYSTNAPPFSRFRKSFPASAENQGLTYIKIVSPTVFIQESQWLLWIARNWGGVQIVGEFGLSQNTPKKPIWGKKTQFWGKTDNWEII